MKLSIDDVFKNSFVLAVNETNEQYKIFCELFKKQQFPYQPKLFSIDYQNYITFRQKVKFSSAESCSFAHYLIVRLAKFLNLDYITIFEDDSYPCIECKSKLEEFLNNTEIPDDCDMLILGTLAYIYDYKSSPYRLQSTSNKNLAKVSNHGVSGTHAYIIFKNAYDKYLNVSYTTDHFIAADGMFSTYHTKNINNIYSSVPSFFIQYKNNELQHSDQMVDKNNLSLFIESPNFIKFIIPCYNVESTIGRMLDSILNQTNQNFHIVCVNDASTDNTLSILQEFKAKFPTKFTIINNEANIGPGKSRNKGVFETTNIKSAFLWFVDGDDVIASNDVIEKQYQFYNKHLDAELICLGWNYPTKDSDHYDIASIKHPNGPYATLVNPDKFIPYLTKNIQRCEDVYQHYVQFDSVPDNKIYKFDYCCYIWSGPAYHIGRRNIRFSINEVINALDNYTFKKTYVQKTLSEFRGDNHSWYTMPEPVDYFISFATLDDGYIMPKAHQRWNTQIQQLKDANILIDGKIYSEHDLDNDWKINFEKYKNDYGYAYWSWKPYLINKMLKTLEYGQSLCYFDGGCIIPEDKEKVEYFGRQLQQIVKNLKNTKFDIALTCGGCLCQRIVRSEILTKFELLNDCNFKKQFRHWQAGLIVLVKTEKSEKLISDWYQFIADNYETCLHFPYLDKKNQVQGFLHNGADQAVLQCILYKGNYSILDVNSELSRYITRSRV